jgi:hypothetical protein
VWSYYPWLNVALRTLEPEALFELRTNRNRNLVTRPEQAVLRRAHVAIAGLSVGANIVSALALAAHACGLAVAPLTAVVENSRTRQAASSLVPAGQHVQMLFRLGRSPGPLPPTSRRDPTWVAS